MKLRAVPLFLFGLAAALVSARGAAAEPEDLRAVRAADEQRLAATIQGDLARLSTLLSDDLRYALSDGRMQTKEAYLAAVRGSRIRYTSSTPEDVEAQPIAPGAVALNGRMRVGAVVNGQPAQFTLRFLSVWRRENGGWRLLAYQSSQLAEVR